MDQNNLVICPNLEHRMISNDSQSWHEEQNSIIREFFNYAYNVAYESLSLPYSKNFYCSLWHSVKKFLGTPFRIFHTMTPTYLSTILLPSVLTHPYLNLTHSGFIPSTCPAPKPHHVLKGFLWTRMPLFLGKSHSSLRAQL